MIIELYIFSVFILSGFLQTVTGFGYAIITAPLLALVLEAKETLSNKSGNSEARVITNDFNQ